MYSLHLTLIKVFCCLCLMHSNLFSLQFHPSMETLDKITEIISKKEKGAYLRFGDGDVRLASGDNDSWQEVNPSLQREMQEAFHLNGPTVLKCLPLGCKEFGGLEPGMFPGNHEQPYDFCVEMLNLAMPIWNALIDDVYSMTALAHCATTNWDRFVQFIKFIRQSNNCILIANENIPQRVQNLLFGSECSFIPAPARNSYTQVDLLEERCLQKSKDLPGYKIVVTSMGCSGRTLQKRLWYKLDDVFFFDFGSLMDAICGWNTRDWIPLVHFDANVFLEKLESALRE